MIQKTDIEIIKKNFHEISIFSDISIESGQKDRIFQNAKYFTFLNLEHQIVY